jgi:hypothetical protein
MADPRIAKIAATLNAAAAAARITIKAQLDTIGDAAVAEVAALFPDWTPGVKVAPGDVLAWDGTLVEVIQGHTTQADWTPDKVPALWTPVRTGLPIPPPDQVTADVDAAAALAAMSTALAPLTGTSTSAQQRAALLALRAAISDALGE